MFLKKKPLFIFYILIVLFLFILTLQEHKKQDTIEHFNESVMLKTRRRKKHSECKTKCDAKYTNPDDNSSCRAYCKCKKRCNGNKKCEKGCKSVKMNIYRNDKDKLKKHEIKEKIKSYMQQEKKEKKKEAKKKEIEKKKTIPGKKSEIKISYIDEIIDKYFTDDDKDKLINTHNSVKDFYKDFRKVLRINK